MIEITNIRIHDNAFPDIAFRWVIEVRLVDKSKGLKTYEWGKFWVWDKQFCVAAHYYAIAIKRLERRLTEILSS